MALPSEMFASLESCDGRSVEEIKQLVNESLANNKDTSMLSTLVDYYLASRSQRCLDVLVAIRETSAKDLFDKLHDCLKGRTRQCTLTLIANIVHKQPPWLHHITSHKILSHILMVIKSAPEPVHIMQASMIVFSLMPMLPVQFGTSALADAFEAFSALAAQCTRRPSHIHESHLKYLKLSLQFLFQYLYGMYPCNFLAYLRGFYGSQDHSRERLTVYTMTIRPLLQRTRVHPLLVTASKDAELCSERWKKKQPYDILVECGQHTLDPKEHISEIDEASSPPPGTLGGSNAVAAPMPLLQPPSKGMLAKGEAIVASSLVSKPCWSPVEACGLAPAWRTVGYSRSLSYEKPFESTEASLPLDLAIEATPEETGCTEPSQQITTAPNSEVARIAAAAANDDSPIRDLGSKALPHAADAQVPAMAEKSIPAPGASGGGAVAAVGCETPFFSTTNNLTTEPQNSVSELPEYQEQQQMAHSMDRLRYFTQCPVQCCSGSSRGRSRSTLERSHSCPRLQGPFVQPRRPADRSNQGDSVDACNPHHAPVTPINNQACSATVAAAVTGYHSLKDVPQSPLEDTYRSLLSYSLSRPYQQGSGDASNLALGDMSPSELLEKHLQLVSTCYMQQAQVAKKKTQRSGISEDKSEEVECLKGQVCLLYTVLLYERHRRDVHMERNRRLLAKAKKIVALEEQTAAYKDQLFLTELESKQYKEKLKQCSEDAKKEKAELGGAIKMLESKIAELQMKNELLTRDNRSMVEQVRHTESARATLQKEVDRNAGILMEMEMELETARSRASMSSSYRQQVESLQKELVTLGEMYKRLEARLQASEPRPQADSLLAMFEEASRSEVAGMKHQLEVKQNQVESLSCRVKQLESTVSSRDAKVRDLKEQLERMEAIHKEQLQSKECRINALVGLCQRIEAQLVEARYYTEQKRESSSEASGGYDDMCASMELDGNSPTVDPTGLLGSYTSNTEMTPVSDMLREAEQAVCSPERQQSLPLEELELSGTVQADEEKPPINVADEKTSDLL
ncbi:tuberous sclerosis 1 protein hamartin isoform X1 [Rhipicephalus microplus]|uniref:tuberous sclerosis 1 protein hamartin isoform X1 n=1 Tax=Rhipicephalus microplus TaxID=6941 RepID=UPI003F6C2257